MSLDRAGILIFRDKISLHNFFRQCKQTKKKRTENKCVNFAFDKSPCSKARQWRTCHAINLQGSPVKIKCNEKSKKKLQRIWRENLKMFAWQFNRCTFECIHRIFFSRQRDPACINVNFMHKKRSSLAHQLLCESDMFY